MRYHHGYGCYGHVLAACLDAAGSARIGSAL
jgi:hypothetical protein